MGPASPATSLPGVVVIEVDRPDRQKRRRHGKSDQLDAVEAARGALSGRCQGRAKSGDAHAEALRALLVAKRSARSTRIRTIVQLRHLMFTAPDELRARLGGLTATQLVNEAAKLRPRPGGDVALHGTKTAAVILARRVHALDAELAAIDEQIGPLVKAAAPELLNIYGVGVDTAAVLLVTAGDNAERITPKAHGRCCVASLRSRPRAASSTTGSASTTPATGTPTTPSGGS